MEPYSAPMDLEPGKPATLEWRGREWSGLELLPASLESVCPAAPLFPGAACVQSKRAEWPSWTATRCSTGNKIAVEGGGGGEEAVMQLFNR